jgi:hypothetical protein
LAGEGLEAQSLGVAIPPIPGTPHTLFVCHNKPPYLSPNDDLFYPQARQGLTVSLLATVFRPPAELKNDDLLGSPLLGNLLNYLGPEDEGGTHLGFFSIEQKKHPFKVNGLSHVPVELLDL